MVVLDSLWERSEDGTEHTAFFEPLECNASGIAPDELNYDKKEKTCFQLIVESTDKVQKHFLQLKKCCKP